MPTINVGHEKKSQNLQPIIKNRQYVKFCLYGFLKNLRFYDAFLLIFFLENNITFSQIGILYAIREVTTNLAEIPSGIIADTYGRKNSLITAFGIYILAFIVFYFSTSFSLLLIAMALIGISDAFRSGTHKGMIMDYLKINGWENHKISYYGHTRSWSQIGAAISALIAGFIVFYSGEYRAIYLTSIVPYVLNFINIATYPNKLNYPSERQTSQKSSIKFIWGNLLESVRKKPVLKIVNSSALHSAFLKSIKDYIQPLLVNLAIFFPMLSAMKLKERNGILLGISYFIIFLLTAQASKLANRLSSYKIKNIEKKTLFIGLFLGALCGILIFFEFWWIAILVFVAIYIIENIRKPILTGVLADNVPNEILTSVISVQSFYKSLLTIVVSIALGVIADHYGIGVALFSVTVFLILLTVFIERK